MENHSGLSLPRPISYCMQTLNPYAFYPTSVREQHEGACSTRRGKPEAENNTKAGRGAVLLTRTKYLNKESRSGPVTVAMAGHSPVITKQVCSAERGLGPGQRAKSACQGQNQGGMHNHSCSMTQAQNQDDSLSLSPGPRSGERLPKEASHSSSQGLHHIRAGPESRQPDSQDGEDACW